MNKNKVLCFGELLLRLALDAKNNCLLQNNVSIYPGGAELNVATALALWNIPVKYCTALPDTYLSNELLQYLQSKNIDVSAVQCSGSRIGLYYLQEGRPVKDESVLYDRGHSSFAELKPGQINWEDLFTDVCWFHFSAICPALNENIATICAEALATAKKNGITISVDLNYRNKLWQYTQTPCRIMQPLVDYCDVIMGNLWSVNALLNIKTYNENSVLPSRENYLEISYRTSEKLQSEFKNCKTVAYTFRMDAGENEVNYYSAICHKGKHYASKPCRIEKVISKTGTGDCFMAGLIYGLYNNKPISQIIQFATAAAVAKFSDAGDCTTKTEEQIRKIAL
jgi:2-dehydro-3-deoxygluconokinase